MLQLKTPLGMVTVIGSPREKLNLPDRDQNNQISESYKLKIAGEKLLERLRTHDDPDDPELTNIKLTDLNAQNFRNRLQTQLDIHRTHHQDQISRRTINNEVEAIVMREYNTAQRKRGMMAKIAKQYKLPYDKVRDIITKYS